MQLLSSFLYLTLDFSRLLKKNSLARLPLLIGAFLSLTSCQPHYLNVQTQYLSRESLASFHVNTPDPALDKPVIGQRLMIEWILPKTCLHYQYLSLNLKVRFKNHEEEEVSLPIEKRKGTYLYTLLQDKYRATQGIATYKVEIRNNECVISSWEHPLWSELILLNQQKR